MNLKNIIKEEFQNILKEGYVMEHENFKFRQEIKNSSFYNFQKFSNDYDIDIIESDIIVNWHIGFWLNKTGVENLLIQIDSVEGTYQMELLNKQTDKIEQVNDKNIAEIPWKFEIGDAVIKKGGTLYIETLEFDFNSQLCRVNFTN